MAFLSVEETEVYVAGAAEYADLARRTAQSRASLVAALNTTIVEAFGRRGFDPWDDAEWAKREKINDVRKTAIGNAYDEMMCVFINGCDEALDEINTLLDHQYASVTPAEYRAYVKEVGKRKNGKNETPWESTGGIKTIQNLLSELFGELGFAQRKPKEKKGLDAEGLADLFAQRKLDLDTIVAALKIYADALGNFVPASVLPAVEADMVMECAAELLDAQDKQATRTLAIA
jgi:hypothetical protein